jgi:uncharacterized protein YjdB
MKKKLITALFAGVMLFATMGSANAEELPVLDGTEFESYATKGTVETMALPIYPTSYPEGFNMYETVASVDADGCLEMLNLLNAERESMGIAPLQLDATMTKAAMYRASEIGLVYRHKNPAGGWGQSEYSYYGGAENIVIGRDSGVSAYSAFETSAQHYIQMTANRNTRVGVGNFGNAWVLVFTDETNPNIKDMSSSELLSYNTENRIAKTVVDSNTYDVKLSLNYMHKTSASITLDKGTTYQTTPQSSPDPQSQNDRYNGGTTPIVPSTVNWSSSNSSIASVDKNGIITGLKNGTATITGELYGDIITYTVTVIGDGAGIVDIGEDYLVKYRTHVQNVGWQNYVADGSMSGTEGRSLRLEGINIDLGEAIDGGITYTTHVENIGWQSYVSDNAMAGTSGRGLRLEGIRIKLTGNAANQYDVYYRTHVQNIGWMAWAKNGADSGSAGYGWRLEGIEIQLIPKGGTAPSNADAQRDVPFQEAN